MSIELCEPTPSYPSNWHVRPNYCRCHPETCCCDPLVVYYGNDVDVTMFRKSNAQEYADLMNEKEAKGK